MTFLSGTYQQEFDRIINNIRTEATDQFVAKIIGQPRIPLLALALNYLFLKERQFSIDQIRDYCTSTMLVQMGLNIHSEVSVDNEDETEHLDRTRLKQMQVLAGDLFSGKFYQILAHRGDMRVIHFLSEATSVINQAKSNLYSLFQSNDKISVKSYVHEVEKIVSSLLRAWLENERSNDNSQWMTMVTSLLTAERISSDLHDPHFVKKQAGIVTQLHAKMEQLIAQSRNLLHEWGCQETRRELKRLIDAFFPEGSYLEKTAEEC